MLRELGLTSVPGGGLVCRISRLICDPRPLVGWRYRDCGPLWLDEEAAAYCPEVSQDPRELDAAWGSYPFQSCPEVSQDPRELDAAWGSNGRPRDEAAPTLGRVEEGGL